MQSFQKRIKLSNPDHSSLQWNQLYLTMTSPSFGCRVLVMTHVRLMEYLAVKGNRHQHSSEDKMIDEELHQRSMRLIGC